MNNKIFLSRRRNKFDFNFKRNTDFGEYFCRKQKAPNRLYPAEQQNKGL